MAALDAVDREVRALWAPPPELKVSEWADQYRMLKTGPLPGQWRTDRAPFQREIMDVFDDPHVHEVVCIKPTQIGWSEILLNIIGKHIHIDPKSMLLVQPSLDDAKGFGKKRVSPMIEACPEVRAQVKEATSRRSGNTLLLKEFGLHFLKLTGANSGKGLRSDSVPIVLFDESDAYPEDVDGEGDPIAIGSNRTEGFNDFKIFEGSTPAKPKGFSRLEKKWDFSDQRHYHVPCPQCGALQILMWRDPKSKVYRVIFERTAEGEVIPESVQYVCMHCHRGIEEKWKPQMLAAGQWIADRPGRSIVGFRLNALYRPWKNTWAPMAQKFVNTKGDHEALKEFITLQLAEFFDESGEAATPEDLTARREQYPLTVEKVPDDHPRPWELEKIPADVAVLTCQADIQETRIEVSIKGFGAGEESWLIAHEVFWGDPSSDPSVWEELERFRLTERLHESGRLLRPLLTLVDSGDQSDAVYDYVMPRQNLRDCVFAVKGVQFHTKPVLVQEGTAKRSNVRLFTVGTSAAKDRIASRLKLAKPGPGYLHFPTWTTEEYFAQLVAEKKMPVKNKRTRTQRMVWVQQHARNEALDLEVYALAALWILQNILDARFRDLGRIASELAGNVPPPAAPARRMRSPGVQ